MENDIPDQIGIFIYRNKIYKSKIIKMKGLDLFSRFNANPQSSKQIGDEIDFLRIHECMDGKFLVIVGMEQLFRIIHVYDFNSLMEMMLDFTSIFSFFSTQQCNEQLIE